MKQIAITVFVILLLIGCAIWSPWANWQYDWRLILGIEPKVELATLQVSSIYGELEVYVDNERKGIVGADSGVLELVDIQPGLREVRLQRPETDQYYVYSELLNFTSDIDTVIAYELGPDRQFSEGHTITARENFLADNSTTLTINTFPEGVEVSLDNQVVGTTPLENYEVQPNDVSEVVLEKDGYETQRIKIFPDDANDRQQLLGYDILLDANLFLLPLDTEVI